MNLWFNSVMDKSLAYESLYETMIREQEKQCYYRVPGTTF